MPITPSNQNDEPLQVHIQDIVAVEVSGYTYGEFTGELLPLDLDREKKYFETIYPKLINKIMALANIAADTHNKLTPKQKENTITRIITNEFCFYTKYPLSMQDFEKLASDLNEYAKKLPNNVHLTLGTFAVESPHGIMNVALLIECGKEPKIRLTVKRNKSDIDASYKRENIKGKKNHLPIFCETIDSSLSDKYITINGQRINFSYNHTYLSTTSGGLPFWTTVEICVDHYHNCAKTEMESTLLTAPDEKSHSPACIQSSHVITSATVHLKPDALVGEVTHADPRHKPVRLERIVTTPCGDLGFGQQVELSFLPRQVCGNLPTYEQFIQKNKARLKQALALDKYDGKRPLICIAIEQNNRGILKELLEHGADLSRPDLNGQLPLFASITMLNEEMFDLLLTYAKNDDLGKKSKDGDDLIRFALKFGTKGMQKKLIGSIRYKDENHLALAAEKNDVELVRLLLSTGATASTDGIEQLIDLAIQKNNAELVELFLNLLKSTRADDETKLRIIKSSLLLIKDSPSNKINELLLSSKAAYAHAEIVLAIREHRTQEIAQLLQQGTKINFVNIAGDSPLDIAIKMNNIAIVRLILKEAKASNPLEIDLIKHSLMIAIEKGNTDICKLLFAEGMKTDTIFDDGSTPLEKAMRTKNLELVQFLLEQADPETLKAKNRVGLTPYAFACAYSSSDIVKLLESKGECYKNEKPDPFFLACIQRNHDVVNYLLEHHKNQLNLSLKNPDCSAINGYAFVFSPELAGLIEAQRLKDELLDTKEKLRELKSDPNEMDSAPSAKKM